MDSVLAALCIVFFAVLTYWLIRGVNLQRDHVYNCKTIYIPETIDVDTAFDSIRGKGLNELKKRARELGATKEFADTSSIIDLRVYIIQTGMSDEHIAFYDVEDEINARAELPPLNIDTEDTLLSSDEINAQSTVTLQGLQEDFIE